MNVALTIAGSDSGGGAGIQADLKTFEAHGVFGTSAITSITAQNTTGVQAVFDIPPGVVRTQLEAVFEDFQVGAVKIGMLSSEPIIRAVADALRVHARGIPIVLDPVMIATGGDRLLREDAVTVLVQELFPLATLVTPNASEAAALTRLPVTMLDEMCDAARAIRGLGTYAVLVKGGHIASQLEGYDGPQAVDVLVEGRELHTFPASMLHTVHTHGTGCTLSSAIAANLAGGTSLRDAVRRAKSYVFQAIANAPGLGHGHGPLLHRWRAAMHEHRDDHDRDND